MVHPVRVPGGLPGLFLAQLRLRLLWLRPQYFDVLKYRQLHRVIFTGTNKAMHEQENSQSDHQRPEECGNDSQRRLQSSLHALLRGDRNSLNAREPDLVHDLYQHTGRGLLV